MFNGQSSGSGGEEARHGNKRLFLMLFDPSPHPPPRELVAESLFRGTQIKLFPISLEMQHFGHIYRNAAK